MVNPKEYQRWQMTSFDERPGTTPARPARAMSAPVPPAPQPAQPAQPVQPAIVLPTAAELEALREGARADGHAEGLAAGQEEGYAAGKQQGYDEGLEQGLRQGREEAADELARLAEVATTFGRAVQDADGAIARDVLELALHLARNMVRTAFEVKPELILPVVREAIDYLPTLQQPALLILHPDDALIVRDSMGHELDKTGWRIVEDAQLARGGCRVDTASNQIDAQIASRWQRLASALHGNVEWLG